MTNLLKFWVAILGILLIGAVFDIFGITGIIYLFFIIFFICLITCENHNHEKEKYDAETLRQVKADYVRQLNYAKSAQRQIKRNEIDARNGYSSTILGISKQEALFHLEEGHLDSEEIWVKHRLDLFSRLNQGL